MNDTETVALIGGGKAHVLDHNVNLKNMVNVCFGGVDDIDPFDSFKHIYALKQHHI